ESRFRGRRGIRWPTRSQHTPASQRRHERRARSAGCQGVQRAVPPRSGRRPARFALFVRSVRASDERLIDTPQLATMPDQPKTIHFISLGCPKNRVDSEVMLGVAERAGYAHSDDPDDVQGIVINTCCFIDAAKHESIDTILAMA